MSKSDRLKAEIAFHEKRFLASLAIIVPTTGWLAGKSSDSSAMLIAGAGLAVLVSTASFV